jgi:hypothetical protein
MHSSICESSRSLKINFVLPVLLIGGLIFSSFAGADTYITITASGDNYLRSDNKAQNMGTDPLLKISQSLLSRDLLKFDATAIANAVSGKQFISAELDLYASQNWGGWGTGRELRLFRLLSTWTESGSSWNCSTANTCTWDGGNYYSTKTAQYTVTNNSTGWLFWGVTDDIAAGTSNYGWLLKKQTSSDTGDIDFASSEATNSVRWPKLVLRVRDWVPPTISCNPLTAPNSNGWHNAYVTVHCSCADANNDLTSCPADQPVISEGANQSLSFVATDARGLSSATTVTLNIDKTAPTAEIVSPANGATVAGSHVMVQGAYQDTLAGGSGVNCNGAAGGVSDGTFTADVSLGLGSNAISCSVTDNAGNSTTTTSISISRVSQLTLTFEPVADTYVGGIATPDANHGSASNLHIAAAQDMSNVLLKFSQEQLSSQIAGGHVASATLQLFVESVDPSWAASSIVDAHRMSADWEESVATLNCSNDSDLTNSAPDCDEMWNGGLYEDYVSASVSQLNAIGAKTLDVTTDVQLLQNGIEQYGWLLRKRNYDDPGSLEFTSLQGTASNKPRLVVVVDDQTCLPTTIQSVSPAWIPSDGSSKTITVSGENLNNISAVLRNGSSIPYTVVNSTTITFSDSATILETHQIQFNSSCVDGPLNVYAIEADSSLSDPIGNGPDSTTVATKCDAPPSLLTELSVGCEINPNNGLCDNPSQKKFLCYKGSKVMKLIGIGLPEAITDDNAYCSNATCMTSNINCINSSCSDTVTRDYFENARYKTTDNGHGSNMSRVWVFGASNSSSFGSESMPFPKDANGDYLVKVATATAAAQQLDTRYKNRLKQVLTEAEKNGQVILLSLFQYSGAFADPGGYAEAPWNPANSNMDNCGLPDSPGASAKIAFYNICKSANGGVCSQDNLTCLGFSERNLVNRVIDVVKKGNAGNTSFKKVFIELANEASIKTGVSNNTYLTWYKTVSKWVKNKGGYLVCLSKPWTRKRSY